MRYWPALLMLITAPPLPAEIAREHYEAMQRKSGEHLRIRVDKIDNEWCIVCSKYQSRIYATVVAVTRSASGISSGNKVFFEYTVQKPRPDVAGPRPMPPLKEEHEYDFFGDKTGVTKDKGIILIPKARGYSFESLLSDE